MRFLFLTVLSLKLLLSNEAAMMDAVNVARFTEQVPEKSLRQ